MLVFLKAWYAILNFDICDGPTLKHRAANELRTSQPMGGHDFAYNCGNKQSEKRIFAFRGAHAWTTKCYSTYQFTRMCKLVAKSMLQ